MKQFEDKVFSLLRECGREFNRADKARLDELIALETDMDEVHPVAALALEHLTLVVADPTYRGDLTLSELEGNLDKETAADEIIAALLG